MATNGVYEVTEVGVRTPKEKDRFLTAGDVGYLVAGIKEVSTSMSGIRLRLSKTKPRNPFRDTGNSIPWYSAAFIRSNPTAIWN